MDRLIGISKLKQQNSQPEFQRYLYSQIDWKQRLILILGHRGVGKTTLMLQKMQQIENKSIYLTLDDYEFESIRLAALVEDLYAKGYRNFFLDEAHRYPYWSTDLKLLYDNYVDAYFVVSGSSILELRKGKGDLSRRAAIYHLAGLSFREFVVLEKDVSLPKLKLQEILDNHSKISEKISDRLDILELFAEYLEYGYYPFYKDSKSLYKSRLLETTNLVLEMDIAPFEELSHNTIRNMKKLIYIISESVPFIPNISKLAERLEVSRNTILKSLDLLEQAQILNLLRASTKGVSFLQKPEKIFLQNTNLAFALTRDQANVGSIRETFFYNQLQLTHEVTMPKYGDFMVDDKYLFEVGGQNKTSHQIKGIPNAYLAADDLKIGGGNKIPLWLFGFLY